MAEEWTQETAWKDLDSPAKYHSTPQTMIDKGVAEEGPQAQRDEKLREDLEALRKEWGWFDVDFWHALAKIIRGEA